MRRMAGRRAHYRRERPISVGIRKPNGDLLRTPLSGHGACTFCSQLRQEVFGRDRMDGRSQETGDPGEPASLLRVIVRARRPRALCPGGPAGPGEKPFWGGEFRSEQPGGGPSETLHAEKGARAKAHKNTATRARSTLCSPSLALPLSLCRNRVRGILDMLFSRPAALLLFFSSSLPGRRPWAAAGGGGRRRAAAGRTQGPEPPEGETDLRGGIPIRRRKGPEEDRRRLETASDSGDTTGAALPYGLPFCTSEYGYTSCNIGCPSKFYTVAGTGGDMTASTCGGATWDTLLYVRAGSTNLSCSELTCVGMCLIKPPLLEATCCTPHFLAND
jgi:hypothetical protein